MKTIPILLATITLATLAGCAGPAKGDGRPCLPVDATLTQAIADGASGVAMTPVSGAAVKAKGFAGTVYMIAMKFTMPSGDDQVGIWASSSLDSGAGPLLAVDGTAQSFTHWPDHVGDTTFSVTTDGVTEAKECLARSN